MAHFAPLRSTPPPADPETSPAPSPRHSPDHSFFSGLRRQYMKWCDDWWLLEILGLGVSCVLTAILWILLAVFDGHELQNFGSIFGTEIRPNAVVSLLTTLSVAASMMVVQNCISQLKWTWYRSARPMADLETYDRASRGTLGSVMLLFSLRTQSLASVGALLTIVHLAMSPLAQQAVKPVPRSLPSGLGHAPFASDWQVFAGSNSRLMAGGYSRIRASMKGAVLGGLFVTQDLNLPDVPPQCDTGNCTFDPYPSLAVCSSVADVTSNLKKGEQPSQGKGFASWCLPQGACVNNNGTQKFPTVANVSSAAGPSAHVDWHPDGPPFAMLNYSSVAFQDRVSPIADFYLIYMNTTHPGYDLAQPAANLQYNAMEFVLDWCVPTFSTNVTNGITQTNRSTNPRLDFKKPSKLADNSPTGLDSYPMILKADGRDYKIDQVTHASLQRYMVAALEGEIDIGEKGEWQITTTWSDGAQAIWTATQRDNNELFERGSHQVSQEQAIKTLKNVVNNTAVSMSNNVRLVSQQTVPGEMQADKIIVEFEKGYLAAITGFVGAALLFFLAVLVFGGTPRDQPAWKSSTNAVLRVVGPQLQERLGGADATVMMVDDTESHNVALKREDDGWRFVEASNVVQKEIPAEDI